MAAPDEVSNHGTHIVRHTDVTSEAGKTSSKKDLRQPRLAWAVCFANNGSVKFGIQLGLARTLWRG